LAAGTDRLNNSMRINSNDLNGFHPGQVGNCHLALLPSCRLAPLLRWSLVQGEGAHLSWHRLDAFAHGCSWAGMVFGACPSRAGQGRPAGGIKAGPQSQMGPLVLALNPAFQRAGQAGALDGQNRRRPQGRGMVFGESRATSNLSDLFSRKSVGASAQNWHRRLMRDVQCRPVDVSRASVLSVVTLFSLVARIAEGITAAERDKMKS
jgi:hypothetical protein